MPVHVQLARSAATYRDNLRGRDKARYQDWLDELKSQGCTAMDYRLTGEFVDRFCMKHLIGPERAVVVFDSPKLATIVLLGPHDAKNPDRDIYHAAVRHRGNPRTHR